MSMSLHVPSASWDLRYLRLAKHVALWSKDPSTQCGAILVRPDKTLASLGFNGFHPHMEDRAEWYQDRSEKYPRILHSEWNSIRNSRDFDLTDYTVYAWPMPPCNACTACLIQRKCRRCVCLKPEPEKLERWSSQFKYATEMWEEVKADLVYSDQALELYPALEFLVDVSKWNSRFLNLAKEVQSWSKDKQAPRATILVRSDKTVSSIGFNGFPQGVNDNALLNPTLENQTERFAKMVSSERNAILFSRDFDKKDYTAYCWPGPPDLNSTVHLLAEGVMHLVYAYVEGDSELDAKVREAWMEVGGSITGIKIKAWE